MLDHSKSIYREWIGVTVFAQDSDFFFHLFLGFLFYFISSRKFLRLFELTVLLFIYSIQTIWDGHTSCTNTKYRIFQSKLMINYCLLLYSFLIADRGRYKFTQVSLEKRKERKKFARAGVYSKITFWHVSHHNQTVTFMNSTPCSMFSV